MRLLLGCGGSRLRFGRLVHHEIGNDLYRLVVVFGEAGQTHRLADLPLDLVTQIDMLHEERARVLAPLAELLALVREPGAGLLDDLEVDTDVDHGAFLRDALAVHDVELALTEGGRDLVLHDLDPGPRANDVGPVLEVLDLADVQPDRGVELEGPASRGRLGRAEHHADLLAQLVDEDGRGLELGEGPGELPHGLRHETRLQADVGVTHLAFDLRPGNERRDRVDHDEMHRARPNQHVRDLERLLAGIRLADQELVDVDTQLARVRRVEGVLGVDERRDAALALRLRDDVQTDGRLARTLRTEDLHHPASRDAADAERDIERQRPGRDGGHPHVHGVLAQFHHGSLAVLLLDLLERDLQHLLAVHAIPLPTPAHPGGGASERTRRTFEHGSDWV